LIEASGLHHFGSSQKKSEFFWRTPDNDLPTCDTICCLAIRDPEELFFSGGLVAGPETLDIVGRVDVMKSKNRVWAGATRVLARLMGRTQRPARLRRQPVANVEALESRQLLAATAPGWEDVSRLSLSFAPDGTSVAGQNSSLQTKLSALGPTAVWQQTILDAFQAWAVNTRVNVGLMSDSGVAAGTSGDLQHDSRFGDIRVLGAALSPDAAALSAMKNETLAGAWFGDLVINTDYSIPNLDALYNIALHEAGHILGLTHSTDPTSPMYPILQVNGRKSPTSDDLAWLITLNGNRDFDSFDAASSVGNDALSNASVLTTNGNTGWQDGKVPVIAWAEIQSAADVDYFKINAAAGYTGPVSFRLQTSGLSQFQGSIQVFNESGVLLGASGATGSNADQKVTVGAMTGSDVFYVRISAVNSGSASEGSFALVATCDNAVRATTGFIQQVVATVGQDLSADELSTLLLGEGSGNEKKEFDSDLGNHVVKADTLSETAKFAAIGQISTASEADLFRFRVAADGQRLTATVRALSNQGLLPALTLVDRHGNASATTVLTNGLGVYTIQSEGLVTGRNYYLKVDGLTHTGPYATGAYKLSMRLGTTQVAHTEYVSGNLSGSTQADLYKFDLTGPQVFQWAVQTNATNSVGLATVEVSLFDSNGKLKFQMVGLPGQLRTADHVLLGAGTYYVKVAAVRSADASSAVAINYKLKGSSISDPISVVGTDTSSSGATGTLTSGTSDPTFQSVLWNSAPVYSTSSSTSVDTNTIYDSTWNTGYLV
jgi:hypothetical protein